MPPLLIPHGVLWSDLCSPLATGKLSPEKDTRRGTFTTGASLSKVLVATYELTCGSKGQSKGKVSGDALQVINALKSLLAVSQSAKDTALDSESSFRFVPESVE